MEVNFESKVDVNVHSHTHC